ncbi:hypothetical protein NDU88_004684 [Pleurodeles waltl]|uniref:Uncharacterized protein n=1 Tax=Pleurodeles waltl TaxID=8319 RepID=A0AAV7RIY4_PLEWA|nr:hypothetical protein NDU88_004684 [Pleurodeles waltl]
MIRSQTGGGVKRTELTFRLERTRQPDCPAPHAHPRSLSPLGLRDVRTVQEGHAYRQQHRAPIYSQMQPRPPG